MSYGTWGRTKEREVRAFHEKLFLRAALPQWDARWHLLTVPARSTFLSDVKGPAGNRTGYGRPTPPSVSAEKIPAKVLQELTKAGLVEVRPAPGKPSGDRVFLAEGATDFSSRVRALGRYHLLDANLPSMVSTYVNACFATSELSQVVSRVLNKVGIDEYGRIEEFLQRYVVSHRWPDWVAKALDDPLAVRILGVVRQAAGPILLAELPGLVAGAKPDLVRASVDKLIAHLVLVEDLEPGSLDLRVGLLPAVRDAIARADQPRRRPPLVICEAPKELGPDESILVGDLRAFLLEVASEPPRLRQDRSLFQKELDRFQAVLDPLAPWLAEVMKRSPEGRLVQALQWARYLKLVKEVAEGKQVHLQLAPKGEKWLAGSVVDQHESLFEPFRATTTPADQYSTHRSLFISGLDDYGYYANADYRFLGVRVVALKVSKGNRPPQIYEAKPKDFAELRNALDRLFGALPLGVFHRLDSLLDHASFGVHNPVLLGLEPDPSQVVVYSGSRAVPPLEERLEEVGRLLIDQFVRQRLIPLGCVRTAIDDQGRLCIAREPWLDAYFGRDLAADTLPAHSRSAAPEASRVVVQPDFSIVIIGPSPAPAAELIPFCERTTRGSGRGAIALKITREAVIKAVAHGLKPAEIVARLKRHASHEVPANVLREVQGWANWVRRISPETLVVLRCPDRETTDRVMTALRKNAERIQETIVAISPTALTAVERHKLQEQGIILGHSVEAEKPKPKAKKKRRARYYD